MPGIETSERARPWILNAGCESIRTGDEGSESELLERPPALLDFIGCGRLVAARHQYLSEVQAGSGRLYRRGSRGCLLDGLAQPFLGVVAVTEAAMRDPDQSRERPHPTDDLLEAAGRGDFQRAKRGLGQLRITRDVTHLDLQG